jgi:hypothetical protein
MDFLSPTAMKAIRSGLSPENQLGKFPWSPWHFSETIFHGVHHRIKGKKHAQKHKMGNLGVNK